MTDTNPTQSEAIAATTRPWRMWVDLRVCGFNPGSVPEDVKVHGVVVIPEVDMPALQVAAANLRAHAADAARILRKSGVSESVADFLEQAVAEFDAAEALAAMAPQERALFDYSMRLRAGALQVAEKQVAKNA